MDVEIRTTEPQSVAYIRMHGPYAQIPEAIKGVYMWAGTRLLHPSGMPSTVYYTMPQDGDDSSADWEVYVPLGRDVMPKEPDKKGRGVRRTDSVQVAVTQHRGPYETIGDTYAALQAWVAEKGYRMAGPPEESYLNDPGKAAPEECLTEIRFPVAKA